MNVPAVAVPVAITLRRCCGLEIGLLRYLSGRQAMGRGEPAPVAAKLQKAVMIERGAGELEAEAEAETEGAAETQRACPDGARLQAASRRYITRRRQWPASSSRDLNEREPNHVSADTLVDAWRRVRADRHAVPWEG